VNKGDVVRFQGAWAEEAEIMARVRKVGERRQVGDRVRPVERVPGGRYEPAALALQDRVRKLGRVGAGGVA